MEAIILNALERTSKIKTSKENKFIAGVFYGDNTKATSVKFETTALEKIILRHVTNAKIWVKYGSDKKFGFIKEVQRNPITGKVIHVDIQLVSQNHEVRMQIPIVFKGKNELELRQMLLQIHKSEVDVLGKTLLIPDELTVDVSEKAVGDTITIKDFQLDKQIKIQDAENEVYASIAPLKEQPAEEVTVAAE